MMPGLLAVFVAGLLSSAHCIGMCGGLAAALGATQQPLFPSLLRHLLYGVGRMTTYSFLGAVGGFAGLYLSKYDTTLVSVQQGFSILAGVLMLFVGASAMGLMRVRWLRAAGLSEMFAPLFNHFLNARSWGSYYLAGVVNGFLPCGLVYAFLAEAVAVGDVWQGAAVMAVFGLGTLPAMTFIGCGSTLLAHRLRAHVFRVAGAFVMLFGVVSIVRAFPGEDGCCHGGDGPVPVGVRLLDVDATFIALIDKPSSGISFDVYDDRRKTGVRLLCDIETAVGALAENDVDPDRRWQSA